MNHLSYGFVFCCVCLIALSCKDDSDRTDFDCGRFCSNLRKCDMFPSLLSGGKKAADGEKYCKFSCENSSSDALEIVESCHIDVEVPDVNQWCDAESKTGKSACARIKQCMLSNYPDEMKILGVANTEVHVSAEQGDGSSVTTTTAAPVCDAPGNNGVPAARSGGSYTCELGILSTIEPFLVQDGITFLGDNMSCIAATNTPTYYRKLHPGPIKAGAKLRGSCASPGNKESENGCLSLSDLSTNCDAETGAGETKIGPAIGMDDFHWCINIYPEQDYIVKASEPSTIDILVPSEEQLNSIQKQLYLRSIGCSDSADSQIYYVCEESVALCSDKYDNDGDGTVDCEDIDCAAFCVENSPLACDDQIDNDGNGAVDCDDEKCVSFAVCIEKQDTDSSVI